MKTDNYRFFIRMAYNGKRFHGWQLQKGVATVQQAVNEALSKLLGIEINVTGCGRTDTGVHASEFYAHFDYHENISDDNLGKYIFRMNQMLGREIAIYDIYQVNDNAHARFDAVSRTYHYRIARKKNPFQADYSYYLFGDLDVDLINKACDILKSYQDFECFSKVNTDANTFFCDIYDARWREKSSILTFEIRANRFLRNMVRAIVGTMLDIGKHKITLSDLRKIIESKNRSEAGYSVPAHGLFLVGVEYPDIGRLKI